MEGKSILSTMKYRHFEDNGFVVCPSNKVEEAKLMPAAVFDYVTESVELCFSKDQKGSPTMVHKCRMMGIGNYNSYFL